MVNIVVSIFLILSYKNQSPQIPSKELVTKQVQNSGEYHGLIYNKIKILACFKILQALIKY